MSTSSIAHAGEEHSQMSSEVGGKYGSGEGEDEVVEEKGERCLKDVHHHGHLLRLFL